MTDAVCRVSTQKRGHLNMRQGRRKRLTAPNRGLEGLLTTRANPRALLDHGLARWSELVDVEVYQMISSTAAAERIAPRRRDFARRPIW